MRGPVLAELHPSRILMSVCQKAREPSEPEGLKPTSRYRRTSGKAGAGTDEEKKRETTPAGTPQKNRRRSRPPRRGRDFPKRNVDHFISKFGSKTQMPVWHSVTYFAGRYRLLLQVPISIDYEKCRLNGAMNSAMIQVNEVTKVDRSRPEIVGATTKGQVGVLE